MDYIKALIVKYPNITDEQEESLINLEGEFLEKGYLFEYNNTELCLYSLSNLNKSDITFNTYIKEGKLIKDELIKRGILTESNYKSAFSLKKLELLKPDELEVNLDNFITEVPENDPKVLDIMSQLKNKTKK